jgi:hypothetical protein
MKIHGGTVLLPAGLRLPENIGDVGDITELNLSDMGLVGKLIRRHSLSVYNEKYVLKGFIPGSISNLQSLQTLVLWTNQLSRKHIAYVHTYTSRI